MEAQEREPPPAASAVLLAGGRSRRMGGVAKAFLPVGGREILQRVLDATAPVCADLVLVTNDDGVAADALARYGWRARRDAFAPPARRAARGAVGASSRPLRETRLRVVADRRPGEGPLAGLEAGLHAARAPVAWAVACDLPFLRPALGRLLLRTVRSAPAPGEQPAGRPRAAVPRWQGRAQPLCAAYEREAGRAAATCLAAGVRRVEAFLERLALVPVPDARLRALGEPARFFLNVNAPGDLERARALARAGPEQPGRAGVS